MYVTFTQDHRFLDGGKSKAIGVAFFDVFENPQKYFDVPQEKYQGPVKDLTLPDKSKTEEKKSSSADKKPTETSKGKKANWFIQFLHIFRFKSVLDTLDSCDFKKLFKKCFLKYVWLFQIAS